LKKKFQKFVKKLSKSCIYVYTGPVKKKIKKISGLKKNLKNCQKKLSKKLSKNCQKMLKKLSKSCQILCPNVIFKTSGEDDEEEERRLVAP
jgi:hypothetical protein